MDDQLQQLIELQKEQNRLLGKHLWRLRFSLMTLLLLTTITAIGLGFVAYQTRPEVIVPTYSAPAPYTLSPPNLKFTPAPAGNMRIEPVMTNP